jgi:hypothetical protein
MNPQAESFFPVRSTTYYHNPAVWESAQCSPVRKSPPVAPKKPTADERDFEEILDVYLDPYGVQDGWTRPAFANQK